MAIASVDKANSETYSVVGTLGIDTHRAKTLSNICVLCLILLLLCKMCRNV